MSSARQSLNKRDKPALIKAIKQLTPLKIADAIEQLHELQSDLVYLDKSLQFFKEEYIGERRSMFISSVQASRDTVCQAIDKLGSIHTIAELMARDEESLIDDLEYLLLDTIKYIDVPRAGILEYTRELAMEIALDHKGFAIEDVMLCLQRAKDGYYGEIYARLDGQVVKRWLRQYAIEKQEQIVARNVSRNMASKAGQNEGRSKGEDQSKLLVEAKITLGRHGEI